MKCPHLAAHNLAVFNLQNKLHRYTEFLFRASAATSIEKEKRKAVKMGMRGRGWEETRSRILPHMQINNNGMHKESIVFLTVESFQKANQI